MMPTSEDNCIAREKGGSSRGISRWRYLRQDAWLCGDCVIVVRQLCRLTEAIQAKDLRRIMFHRLTTPPFLFSPLWYGAKARCATGSTESIGKGALFIYHQIYTYKAIDHGVYFYVLESAFL